MAVKKTEVIFRIGLLAVLANVVSSDILYTAETLKYIPEYEQLVGKKGQGALLKYTLINEDSKYTLSYDNIENGIRFGDPTGQSSDGPCRGLPGIKTTLRLCKKKSGWSAYSCLLRTPDALADSDLDTSCDTSTTDKNYCYTGMSITPLTPMKPGPTLMRLIVMFYDNEKNNFIGVQMMLFQTPTTKNEIALQEKHNVLVSDAILPVRELSKLAAGLKKKGRGNLRIKGNASWMNDVLLRAKFISSAKTLKLSKSYTDLYYAGAVVMPPEVFTALLQLDPRLAQDADN